MGLYAYYEARVCVPTVPASDGNFLKLNQYVWGCGYKGIGDHIVYELVLHLGNLARCFKTAACSGVYKRNPSNKKLCICSKFIAPDGRSCFEKCDSDQHSISTSDPKVKQCVCNKHLGISGKDCVDNCGDYQTTV